MNKKIHTEHKLSGRAAMSMLCGVKTNPLTLLLKLNLEVRKRKNAKYSGICVKKCQNLEANVKKQKADPLIVR